MSTILKKPAASSVVLTRQQPVLKSSEIFATGGKTYLKLTFSGGLTLKQAIAVTEGMKVEGAVMLTSQAAEKISDNIESRAVFKERLKLGEWTYVRDLEVESSSLAARLCHDRFDGRLYVDVGRPFYVSFVLVLEKTNSEAAITQDGTQFLHLEEKEAA